jgi:hypothetical protein
MGCRATSIVLKIPARARRLRSNRTTQSAGAPEDIHPANDSDEIVFLREGRARIKTQLIFFTNNHNLGNV